MLWVWPLLFGIGCAVAMRCAPDHAARTIAAHLVVVWALANAAWASNMLWVLPVLDLGLGIASIQIGWATPAKWVALVVDAVAIRLVLHVLDGLTGHLFFVAYVHALNAAFVWMLFMVASAGGGHGCNRLRYRIRDYLRSLSAAPRPAQAR
jgi:hypothetical protein